MARERGNQNRGSPKGAPERAPGRAEGEPRLIPDLARRALSLGLSGFFLTEETIRKALGDSVPRDWTDFLAAQSERTRTDFLERLSYEVAQSLEKLDMASKMVPMQDATPATAHLFIVNPLTGGGWTTLFSTHPPIAERIARLRAMSRTQAR